MTRNKIYESPDNGETVYIRDFGSSVRTLYYESETAKLRKRNIENQKMWTEIEKMAETNPAMKDALDKLIMLYKLLKDV